MYELDKTEVQRVAGAELVRWPEPTYPGDPPFPWNPPFPFPWEGDVGRIDP